MPVYGIELNRCNPSFTINDFLFWMPSMKGILSTEEGITSFNNLYPIANSRIFYSTFGVDWKYAMSLCIMHYMYLISSNSQTNQQYSSMSDIFNGSNPSGVLSSASIGSFSKSFDFSKTMLDDKDALFWNQSRYGQQLMALLMTKTQVIMFVANKNTSYLPPETTYSSQYDMQYNGGGMPDSPCGQFSGCGRHKH